MAYKKMHLQRKETNLVIKQTTFKTTDCNIFDIWDFYVGVKKSCKVKVCFTVVFYIKLGAQAALSNNNGVVQSEPAIKANFILLYVTVLIL